MGPSTSRRWSRIAHLYLVGHFYNTYAPGGVGGDVIRGVAGRKAFGDLHWASATSGVAVVFIERVVGVSALLVLATGAYLIRPIPGMEGVGLWAAFGLAAAASALIGIAVAPRLAPFFPERARQALAGAPTPLLDLAFSRRRLPLVDHSLAQHRRRPCDHAFARAFGDLRTIRRRDALDRRIGLLPIHGRWRGRPGGRVCSTLWDRGRPRSDRLRRVPLLLGHAVDLRGHRGCDQPPGSARGKRK